MENINSNKCFCLLVRLLFVFFLGFGRVVLSQNETSMVYIVTLKQLPTLNHLSDLSKSDNDLSYVRRDKLTRQQNQRGYARSDPRYTSYLIRFHDSLLKRTFKGESYQKLYSYHYLINGFAILLSPQQAKKLGNRKEVADLVPDFSVRLATTHTPEFLGLPGGAWVIEGGPDVAGKGIVIGLIDTGIDPTHPSFSDDISTEPYPVPPFFSGVCEVTKDFPSGSCNRKLIGARHFAVSAITRGLFNASQDYASPFDGDGHGTHTASIAAGNHNIPVIVAGQHFGNASGMAPHAHIAVYKALYKRFGGFAADVVAAIDQAAQDGVDIISLSITPNRRPPGITTFFNPIDMALLLAVKAGIFVVQAAGNTGPSYKSISSFSPWVFSVGAATHDRTYSNSIVLGNNVTIPGIGLAPGTDKDVMCTLVSAVHALNETVDLTDLYLSECQDPSQLIQELVLGNILICSYTVRFVLGLSSVKQALDTAENLGAAGVVFLVDPFVTGFQLNPMPMKMPGLIISSADNSKDFLIPKHVHGAALSRAVFKILLKYYNDSLVRNASSSKIIQFGGSAKISGGLQPSYNNSAPKVLYYSARGPVPETIFLDDADFMKPNLVAPGNFIWAAWSSGTTDSEEFGGERFAMLSGTSMATPHVAGIAAMIKQKFPNFSPSAIGSALSTTASLYDNQGGPIMAQHTYSNPDLSQSQATPFDMGSGFVNVTAALDPGLILDASYDDFFSFLCGINGSSPTVMNYTSQACGTNTLLATDLNLPSITVAKLKQSLAVHRVVTNIAGDESYSVSWSAPYGVSVAVLPNQFFIANRQTQNLTVFMNATMNSTVASFGRIGIYGNRGHVLNIPVSVISKTVFNSSTNA